MKHTVGLQLIAGVANNVVTIPPGYKAEVSLLFISNLDANNKTTSAYWEHAHDTQHKIYIIANYPMASHTYVSFSEGDIILQSGDRFVVTPEAGATQSVLLTFDLYKENAIPFMSI